MLSRFLGLCCAVAFLLPGQVLAQPDTQWRFFRDANTGLTGAAMCPINDTQSGNFWCFSLACKPNEPRKFTIYMGGGDVPDGLNYVAVNVDGRQAGVIEMERSAPGASLELNGFWDTRKHAPMIEAMKRGNSARIDVIQGQVQSRFPMTLRNSRAVFDQALAACPDIPVAVQDPRAELLSELGKECSEFGGGTVVPSADFEVRDDVTGDGLPDIIFNQSGARCSAAATIWCGSAGCPVVIYRALATGGYQKVFNAYARDWRKVPGDLPIIEFSVHGTNCGGVGADACVVNQLWNGEAFQIIR